MTRPPEHEQQVAKVGMPLPPLAVASEPQVKAVPEPSVSVQVVAWHRVPAVLKMYPPWQLQHSLKVITVEKADSGERAALSPQSYVGMVVSPAAGIATAPQVNGSHPYDKDATPPAVRG
jgi:hypothetical protein